MYLVQWEPGKHEVDEAVVQNPFHFQLNPLGDDPIRLVEHELLAIL